MFGESGSISGSLDFLSAEYDEFIGFQDDFTGQEVDVSGNDLPRAPDFNATISIVPTTFEGLGGTWAPQLQVHYETESLRSADATLTAHFSLSHPIGNFVKPHLPHRHDPHGRE